MISKFRTGLCLVLPHHLYEKLSGLLLPPAEGYGKVMFVTLFVSSPGAGGYLSFWCQVSFQNKDGDPSLWSNVLSEGGTLLLLPVLSKVLPHVLPGEGVTPARTGCPQTGEGHLVPPTQTENATDRIRCRCYTSCGHAEGFLAFVLSVVLYCV